MKATATVTGHPIDAGLSSPDPARGAGRLPK